jgi:hypothetical protein
VIFRRPYRDVIRRQLAMFEQDNTQLIDEIRAAERAYDRSDREDAEERFGKYSDLVETATETLAELRDHFAGSLGDDAAEVYCNAFNRAVLRRWPPFALELEDR